MQSDLRYDDVDVKYFENAKLGDRDCQHIQVTHSTPADHFDYHIARIFMDKELGLPVYFASYLWPEEKDGEPLLKEEYIFTNINLKPDFVDADFQADNPSYAFDVVDHNPQRSLAAEPR